MKNATPWKWLGIFALLLSPLFNSEALAQCSYELSLDDSFGDGWNGNTVDVRVGAVTTNYTLSNGFDTTVVLTVNTGDTIQITYNATGLYQSEVSFELFDANQASIFASGSGPSAGLNVDTTAFCPTCVSVNSMTLDSATSSSVSVSWPAVANASSYTIEWGPCGFGQGTGTVVSATTNNYTITGLMASECVDVYITTDCSGSGNGIANMTGPYSFRSLQPVISTFPFFTNFESNNGFFLPSGTNSSWEWGVPAGSVITGSSSPSNAWVTNLSGDYNNSENSFLTSAVFDLSAETGSFILTFDLFYETENNFDEVWVEMSTDGLTWTKLVDNGTAVNWYNDLGNQWWENTNNGWNGSSIILANIAGQSIVQFRFAFSSDGSVSREGVGIDDFGLQALTCGVPSAFASPFISTDSLGISWTSSSGFSNIEYGLAGFTQGSGTMIQGATGTDTIGGLLPGTTYDIYLQDSCSPGNVGLWVGPFSVTTLQPIVNTFPYTEDFEADAGNWIAYGSNSSWQWGAPSATVISAAGQGTNAWVTNLSGSYNNSELSYLQTVIFDASSTVNDLEYTFSMNFETENNFDEGWVEYSFDGTTWTKLVDNGSASGWYNDLNNQWWEDTDGGQWVTRSNVIPGSAGQSFVQIRHVFSSDGSVTREGFGVDDVMVDELVCSVPSALGATNIGTTTADIFFTSTAMISNVEWGPSGFVQGTGQGTVINAMNDTIALSGLTPNTCYDFYVQDSCANGNSIWVGPFVFCTDPTCIAPMNLGTNNVDSTNATLVWDGNNVPGTYLIEYGTPGFALGTGTMITSTADSVTLSNLANATDYCFYVAEICTPGDTSAWSGPNCFTTLCGTIQGDSIQDAIQVTGSGQWVGNATCYSNTLALRTGVEVIFEYTPSPGTTLADFETCGSGYDTYLYLLDANQTTLNSSDDDCGLQSQLLGEAVIPGQTYYVVVEAFSSFTTVSNFVLTITETNPCPAPSNFTTTAVNCTSLDLIWNNGGSSYAYELEYGATGFNPGSGTAVVSNDTTETVSGLTAGTAYDFYVRGFCTSDTSAWAGPFTISTSNVNNAMAVGTFTITNVTLTDAIVDFDGTGSTADSISWDYDDGSAIEWGSTPQHTYTQNGTYDVVVTAYTDCGSDDDTIQVVISTISLTEAGAANFSVYPNPSYGDVTVSFEGATGNEATINLMNLQGQILETIQVDLQSGTRDIQMDLSNLPKGVYMIRYNEENAVAIRRVVLK
ncbi:T9SS type A sorting domain-containing protein [Phaeocystidibacter luteus]|uniref:T9SS type A sorting domain-containing protein n=1 Tax=Phaeocystidibacter luteus TaxID=911197 RepID=A0A6N6RKI7_9FLAO|nr:T9SS type A sorting domain-containing protein [Phaeocystidibacter luteus]KAB2807303.1 T9SS type A sorting domain-containing protein [Phaeocystidibacter luteus]